MKFLTQTRFVIKLRLVLQFFLISVALGLWTPTLATPIVYKLSGDFTGTVNANLFLNAPFVLTGVADTDTIFEVDVGVYINPIESLSINLFGIGVIGVQNPFYFFVNQGASVAGFIDGLLGDVLDFESIPFAFYDGSMAMAAFAVSTVFLAPFDTTQGTLEFNRMDDVTFAAFVPVNHVPEPPTVTIFLAGLLLLMHLRRRSRKF